MEVLQESPVVIGDAQDKSENDSLKLVLEDNEEIVFDTPSKQSPVKHPEETEPHPDSQVDQQLKESGLEFDFDHDQEDPNLLLNSLPPNPHQQTDNPPLTDSPPKPTPAQESDLKPPSQEFDFDSLEEDGGEDPNAI